MGRCLTFIAIRNADPDRVCKLLRLARTGEFGPYLSAPLAGAISPNGWYLVVSDRSTRFHSDSVTAALSAGTAVLSCFLEEHVMYSSCSFWDKGVQMWSLEHDCNYGVAHLRETGAVPPEVAAIADARKAKQASSSGERPEVDYVFDVPEAAMEYIIGIRSDGDNSDFYSSFERLRPLRIGWLERLKLAACPRSA